MPLTMADAFGSVILVQKGVALGVPSLALAAAGGLWAQAKRAANAPVPSFNDLDPSGVYGAPQGAVVRIVVLGDSSVTGPGLGHPSRVWVARLADRLPWNVELVSHARGGSRVRDVLRHQHPAAVMERPDLFVLAVGANDALHGTTARQFGHDLGPLLDGLRCVAPVATLGVGDLSVIPRVPPALRVLLARRSAAIDRAHAAVSATRGNVVRVPVSELSDRHFKDLGRDVFAPDMFHPNERGHDLWAELFAPFVREALQHAASNVVELRDHASPPS